jgi:hypothetical protein
MIDKDSWEGILQPKMVNKFLLTKITGFTTDEANTLTAQLTNCNFIVRKHHDHIVNLATFTFESDIGNKVENIIAGIRPAFNFNFEIHHLNGKSIEEDGIVSKIKCNNAKFKDLFYSLDYAKNDACKFVVTFECEEIIFQK